MTTPEGWRDEQGVKTCALGSVGGGKSGERGGAWSTHLALWEWISISVLLFSRHRHCCHRLPGPPSHGFLPSASVLGLFGSPKDQGILLGPPEPWDARDWGKVVGSRGVVEIPCPQEGKVLPTAGLEMSPRDFFSWTPFLLGVGCGPLPVTAAAGADATATPW